MNPPGGFGGGGGGLSLSGPRTGSLGGLPTPGAPGVAAGGGPPPPFPPGFSMLPPVGTGGPPVPRPGMVGLPPPGSAGPGGGPPPSHPGAAMGHLNPSVVNNSHVPRAPFPAAAAGAGGAMPPGGAGMIPGGAGVGGAGFPPPLMAPPAMSMLMPDMAALTSLGVPVLAPGGRKPKNMQPPTQDMGIPPNQTIYINNINDRVKLTELKENLKSMFKQFGEIRQIVAMSSFWRRGQAWIVFASVDAATKAIQGMQGFVYHGQPLRINYSITKSDIIAKEDGTFTPRPPGPKKPRAIREREERQRELFLQMQHQYMQMQAGGDVNGTGAAAGGLTNGNATLDQQQQQQQQGTLTTQAGGGAPDQANNLKRKAESQLPSPQPPKHGDAFVPGPPPMSAPAVDMNFPAMPNKVLFLENLPEDATMEGLVALFSMHPGMSEVRPVLWRRVAFVEYENELMAANAMNALQGYNMNGSQIKITYARR